MQAIEDSLERLQMDYVDLYYIHHVDVQTPLEEMLRALDDLVHQGKVRYTACSNYQAWRLSEALWMSDIPCSANRRPRRSNSSATLRRNASGDDGQRRPSKIEIFLVDKSSIKSSCPAA